jgi:hypothetical protein
MGLKEGDEGLGYVKEGRVYTTWNEIVNEFGRCRSAFDLIMPSSLDTEGYLTEYGPFGECRYPIECGAEGCGLLTTFCCTNQSGGGTTSCKTYEEILPARNGVTVDLDQRTCTLP